MPIHKEEVVLEDGKSVRENEVKKTDDGKKLSDGEMHNGIGLINVLLRLKIYFHRDDVFDIPPGEPGKGATFIIRIPENV